MIALTPEEVAVAHEELVRRNPACAIPGHRVVALSQPCAGAVVELAVADGPPKAFRVFTKGLNRSYQGDFRFDDEAAALVMADVAGHGNRLPIDYNHAMGAAKLAADPAKAGEAAGWFTPALRDGELWATDVEWMPDAAERLKAKRYRFTSATFTNDSEGRINSLRSIALTNVPAMHGQEALCAQIGPEPVRPPGQIAEKPAPRLAGSLEADALAARRKHAVLCGVNPDDFERACRELEAKFPGVVPRPPQRDDTLERLLKR